MGRASRQETRSIRERSGGADEPGINSQVPVPTLAPCEGGREGKSIRFHRRVRENTPRVDGTRHEAHGNVHHVSRPTGRRGGRASEERTRHAEATTVRSYNRRYPHRDEKKRPYAPERPETTKSRGMNDSPWPMPRVAKDATRGRGGCA